MRRSPSPPHIALVAALRVRLVAGAVEGRIQGLRTGTPAERLARLKAESQEDLRASCMGREFSHRAHTSKTTDNNVPTYICCIY